MSQPYVQNYEIITSLRHILKPMPRCWLLLPRLCRQVLFTASHILCTIWWAILHWKRHTCHTLWVYHTYHDSQPPPRNQNFSWTTWTLDLFETKTTTFRFKLVYCLRGFLELLPWNLVTMICEGSLGQQHRIGIRLSPVWTRPNCAMTMKYSFSEKQFHWWMEPYACK